MKHYFIRIGHLKKLLSQVNDSRTEQEQERELLEYKNSFQNTNKIKAPLEVYLEGGENPAATYSPGPEGQVPSAMAGLTSVFGMGTGVTLPRSPLKQTFRQEVGKQSGRCVDHDDGTGLPTHGRAES